MHDESFCVGRNQHFVPASEVIEAGNICSCKDILDYLTNIGTCLTNGVYSPIIRDNDCADGTLVYPTDEALILSKSHQFTACDLKCNADKGHASSAVPDDTYKEHSFPKFEWYVAYSKYLVQLVMKRFGFVLYLQKFALLKKALCICH